MEYLLLVGFIALYTVGYFVGYSAHRRSIARAHKKIAGK